MNYVGIDLHSNNNYAVIVDQAGQRIFEKRLPNELGAILTRLQEHTPIASVAVESTYNYYWLTDGLLDAGYKVLLANPLAMAPYSGLKHQDDKYDAGWMAELQRLGILPQSHLYGRQWRGLRDLLRQRSRWVREKVRVLLSLQSRYARCLGVNLSQSDLLFGELPALGDVDQELAAQSQVRILRSLMQEIDQIEQRVDGQLNWGDEPYRRLKQVHGIGPVLASTIVLETGALSRFGRVGEYASYARVVQSGRWTNFRKKGKGNRRCGNKYLGWAYHEAAHSLNCWDRRVQQYRRQETRRGKHARSIWSAMANKICRGFYFVMRDGVEFSSHQLFGCGEEAEGGSQLNKGSARRTEAAT